ncbi:Creatinine amidohydrolase [Thermobacillus xylanilyticus]|jgi:creatinine amidohydrolase/NitT/TauT family transport system ATP-binding protein|uniref:Creatinine amidohydrolase n=1 Tax=Thermobacillus xylanilyticus TaxID=76633 RepID=A0ABM8V951_THEXY|nr:creatininase family protein [Thermobacillus xylanilyticus]REJ19424.1 MAG: creatininase [Paenibacillaceae bacterium]CAG5093083.1 Creatinine amidohydrolase [Thermobacillus xylanilyticus]
MFNRYAGAAWEERFLPRLSSPEIRDLPKENALVILPVGAIEQHGPHMPVMTDTLIGEAVLTRTMELLPKDSNIWLLPPLAYGKSNEHLDFAGTISLSAATLLQVLLDIAASVKRSGFRRLLLLNTHGGNQDLMLVAAREIRIANDLMVFYISPGSLAGLADLITEEEREYGIHAGDYETSLVMAVKPDWVHPGKRIREVPDVASYQYLTLEGKIRFAWVMADISESGMSGDATRATAEKGEIMLRRIASHLANALQEMCDFDISGVKMKPSVAT